MLDIAKADTAPRRSGHKPREHRHPVIIRARMRADRGQTDVCIRNISSRGMLIQSADPPLRGTYVEIARPNQVVVGRVVWASDRKFGIQTREKIDVGAMLNEANGVRPASPQNRLQALANPGAAPAPLPRVDYARKAEASRHLGSVMQFALALAGGMAAALLIAALLYDGLIEMTSRVSHALG